MKVPPACFPRVLGHEAVRVVESVGENVAEVAEGEVVIPTFLSDCGECEDCCSEKSNLCSKFPFKIDPAIPPNRACLFACCVAAGVGACWKTANVEAGSAVVIFGLGSVGLAVAKGARVCGANRIIGADVNPEKFEIGKIFRVTEFINSKDCGHKSLSQVIRKMTEGGADYCFECVGLASLVQEAYARGRQGRGKTIVMGVDKPGTRFNLSSYDVLHSGKIIAGALFGGVKTKSGLPVLLKRYMDKELQIDEFVTHEVRFEDINKALELRMEVYPMCDMDAQMSDFLSLYFANNRAFLVHVP